MASDPYLERLRVRLVAQLSPQGRIVLANLSASKLNDIVKGLSLIDSSRHRELMEQGTRNMKALQALLDWARQLIAQHEQIAIVEPMSRIDGDHGSGDAVHRVIDLNIPLENTLSGASKNHRR